MADSYSATNSSTRDVERIKRHLEKIQQIQDLSPELSSAISAAHAEFDKFFKNYGKPEFTAYKLLRHDTPKSNIYNENLETLDKDLERLYLTLQDVSNTSLSAYNYAAIATNEITTAADIAASKVLDLSIINNFNKGSVIVAGDDFVNSDKIDTSIGIETTQADFLEGANAISLKRETIEKITHPNTSVNITPIAPEGTKGAVNTNPTPLNLERFYEGRFYAHIGEQEPEGGKLNLQYILNPSTIPTTVLVNNNGKNANIGFSTAFEDEAALTSVASSVEDAVSDTNNLGFFAVIDSSDNDKIVIRQKMFDDNPDTYWQAEFVYKVDPLLDPFDNLVEDAESPSDDVNNAEDLAKKYDFQGRDLIIHIDIVLDNVTPVNFVLINPVLFGTSAFIKVIDVATAGPDEDFSTVDGFNEQSFDKILTPEANKVISGESAEKLLAPSQFSYKGLGVFSFPVRLADKIRLTVSMESPVPNIYERLHILTQEVVTVKTKIKTKKKGLF